MQDYTSQDFLKMQEQAIKRVHEMQKRSSFPQEKKKQVLDEDDVRIYQKLSKNAAESKSTQNIITNQNTKKIPIVFDLDKDKKTNTNNEGVNIYSNQMNYKKKFSPLSTFLSMDNDMALILPLVLLLGKEGADDILLLALLYILT